MVRVLRARWRAGTLHPGPPRSEQDRERAPADPRASSHDFSASEGRLPAGPGQEDLLPAQRRVAEAQIG